MVDYKNDSLDATLVALADPTRRAMLKQLSRKSCTVNELASPHEMTLAGISKHLMVLEKAKLVIKQKEGRTQHCRLNPKPMKGVAMLLLEYKAFWENQLDALEIYMKKNYRKESNE